MVPLKLFAGSAMLLCLVGVASANLITNGDFQTGDFTGWTFFTTTNGTINTPTVVSFDVTGGGASLAAQFDVGEVVFNYPQQAGGGMKQTFLSGAGATTITADIASFNPSLAGQGDFGSFSLVLDGTTVASHSFGAADGLATLRSALSFTGVLTAGSHELNIEMTRAYQSLDNTTPWEYVDNVVVNGPAGIPEPATLALLGLGLAGLGFSRRRQ